MKSQIMIPIGGKIQPCRPITSIVGIYILNKDFLLVDIFYHDVSRSDFPRGPWFMQSVMSGWKVLCNSW